MSQSITSPAHIHIAEDSPPALEIPLSGNKWPGRVALIDPEDYHLIENYMWYCADTARSGDGRWLYAMGRMNGRRETKYMHRVICGVTDPRVHVDHINHNTLDNRRCNLRIATHQQNHANRRPHRGSTSKYKGVHWHKGAGKWRAGIVVDRKQHYLGLFEDEGEAARAYDTAATKYFGDFARLNFPEEVR